MASGQNEEFSVKADQNAGQAPQVIDNTTNSSQTSAGFLQQKGEEVKSMAQGASEAVKNKLGMNNDYKNKNPLDRKNPNNTTCPSMPAEDHYCRISSDTSTTTTTTTSTRLHQQYLQCILRRSPAPFMPSLFIVFMAGITVCSINGILRDVSVCLSEICNRGWSDLLWHCSGLPSPSRE
ncbi:unnamed protein product [Brassica rapa subsp. narinosa]